MSSGLVSIYMFFLCVYVFPRTKYKSALILLDMKYM